MYLLSKPVIGPSLDITDANFLRLRIQFTPLVNTLLIRADFQFVSRSVDPVDWATLFRLSSQTTDYSE